MRELYSLFRDVLAVFPPGGRRFVLGYSWLLASLSILDVAALGLLAVIIGPLASGQPVTLPVIGELTTTGVIGAIVIMCALMISKGFFSIVITRWGVYRIARYEVAIGDRLFRAYINAPWMTRLRRNSADMLRFSDSGVDAAVNAFIIPGASLIGEVVSLVAVIATLAVVQPLLALVTLVYMLAIGLVLHAWIGKRSRAVGENYVKFAIRTGRLVLEIVGAMKEVALRNKESEVAGVVKTSRTGTATARAAMIFLATIPRYVLEAGLVGGFLLVGAMAFILGGPERGPELALSAVALFGLAGFRIAPSVVRVQSVVSGMLANMSYSRRLLEEMAETELAAQTAAPESALAVPENATRIRLSDVTFRYADDAEPAISNLSLDIDLGTTVAFVGESGSGKSTLVDLVLGLIEPTHGDVFVDDVRLSDIRRAWRERVAYVPQEVALFDATIAQNVALTWSDDADRHRVRSALERAQLWDVVGNRDGGIDAPIGERGIALSGGQRQRLGIARALYTDPLVLVMDEATSALDSKTEAAVTESIANLGGDVTVIVVAHRLATIKHSDRIFFLRHGELAGAGTFEQLVTQFPDFAEQAQLAGLA
ncbi:MULTISPECIES: ABC transporter ATP-binding protein [unclassified Cryobacterium]|uniref:ABC transporter ATP-binding protein n=1 Tax=unclassified Cryobacterium TaxID=2649013 RepID=UPI001447E9E2|nr:MULTISPECIES: ABC transporter ATP-binding protein [unclassified Cryobacterium]